MLNKLKKTRNKFGVIRIANWNGRGDKYGIKE